MKKDPLLFISKLKELLKILHKHKLIKNLFFLFLKKMIKNYLPPLEEELASVQLKFLRKTLFYKLGKNATKQYFKMHNFYIYLEVLQVLDSMLKIMNIETLVKMIHFIGNKIHKVKE